MPRRNMMHNNHMIDQDMNQQNHGYLHSQNIASHGSHHLPDHSAYHQLAYYSGGGGGGGGNFDQSFGTANPHIPSYPKVSENFQRVNASASSNSSVLPFNTIHLDEAAAVNVPHFVHPHFMGPVLPQNHNQYLSSNYYAGEPFPIMTGSSSWCSQPFMTYGGSFETGGGTMPNYHDTTICLPNNFHFPSQQSPPPSTQLPRVQNFDLYPQVGSSRVHPSYALNNNMHTPQGISGNPRMHRRSVPPRTIRNHSPHREVILPEISSRRPNRTHLRSLPVDEVVILDFPHSRVHARDYADDHVSGMRLEIDEMTYEELLALGDQIGNVSPGLSEATIEQQLKTRRYLSSNEPGSCVICQEEYKRKEKIGSLACRHEYHAGCLKKWLLVKNVCPICKAVALKK